MKKLLKIFFWFIGVIIFLVIALTVIAKLAENKITDIALRKVSESIEAPVTIDNVSFNLLRKFPLATIELEGVLLGAHKIAEKTDSLSTSIDTLISIQKIYVSVKSRPLLKGNVEIIKVDIDGAKVNYLVDTSGVSNIDFLISSSESEEPDTLPSEPLIIDLKDFTVTNIICKYKDDSLKVDAKVKIPELKVKAKVEGENIIASIKGGINLSNCSFEETNLHLMNNTDVNFEIDYENDSVNIKQLVINTDGADMNLMGNVLLGDEIKTDIILKGTDLIIDELIKYAPEEMLQEFGLQKVSGKMNLDATVKGVYSDNELPKVDLKVNFQDGNIVTTDYPELKSISFQGKITNGILRNNQSTQAEFSTFHFETHQSKFDFAFSILDIDHPKYDIKTDLDVNVGEFSEFIPDSMIKFIKGKIKASISTKGEIPDTIGDDFVDYVMANSRANVSIKGLRIDPDTTLSVKNLNGDFAYEPNKFKVNNLSVSVPAYKFRLKNTSFISEFEGSINNTSEMSLNVKSYHIETKKSVFKGSAKVKNFDHPTYKFNSNVNLNLGEVRRMLPDTLFKTLRGSVLANISSSGTLNLDSIEEQAMDIAFNSSSLKLNFRKVYVEMPDDTLYKIENLRGFISMKPKVLSINKLRGRAGGVDFRIDSTRIRNLYKVLIQEDKNETVRIKTNISLGELNNDLFAIFMGSDSTCTDVVAKDTIVQSQDLAQSKIPDSEITDTSLVSQNLLPNFAELGIPHFLIRGKLVIAKIEYEKNVIDDISLKFRFTDSLYVIDQFKLSTCGGQMNTSLMLNARGRFWDKPVVDIRTKIDKLNINELLLVNDNFGDTSITYEKFAGLLTSELDVRAFYKEGTWPTDRIRAEGHFTLDNGKIYGYEPLVDLSNNKLVGGLKELDKLDFINLNVSIFMLNDKIYIPKTSVVTSSMDITAFAMHGLQDKYEYHLELKLGDVLTGKSERLIKEQEKQNKLDGVTEERKGIRLVSLKLDGNKKNGFDNDKLKEKFEVKLDKQQGWLKLFFNPLLVNFSTEFDRTAKHDELIEKYEKKD